MSYIKANIYMRHYTYVYVFAIGSIRFVSLVYNDYPIYVRSMNEDVFPA